MGTWLIYLQSSSCQCGWSRASKKKKTDEEAKEATQGYNEQGLLDHSKLSALTLSEKKDTGGLSPAT